MGHGARREVTDLDRQPRLFGQALQLDLPQARTIAVCATADCGDRQVNSPCSEWLRTCRMLMHLSLEEATR